MFLHSLALRFKPLSKPPISRPRRKLRKQQPSVYHEEEQDTNRIPAYPYRELTGTDIRLVKILPGAESDVIRCYVDQVPLSSKPTYYALSYVWGDPGDLRTIILDGQPFEITKNLYEALDQLRRLPDLEYLKDYIWADAICINQNDNEEKSREVPRMAEIYGSCLQVLIWLGSNGPPTSNSNIKQLLRRASLYKSKDSRVKHLEQLFNPNDPTPDDLVEEIFRKRWTYWFSQPEDEDDDELILRRVFGSSYNAMLRAWAEIMARPWFERTWTIQEACIPVDPVFYVGSHSIPLTELESFIRILGGINRILFMSKGMSRVVALAKLRNMRNVILDLDNELNTIRLPTAEVLVRLLSLTSQKQSENPRDQIYGILGLLDWLGNDIPPELTPDYDQPWEDLYWNCTAYILESIGDLRLLNCGINNIRNRPSWVADLRYVQYRAPGLKCRPSVSLSADRRILFLQGFIIGTHKDHIARCSVKTILPHPGQIPEALSHRLRAVEERILKPSAAMRGTTVKGTLDGFLKDGQRIFDAWELEACRQTYRHLCETHGERSWIAKKTVNLAGYGKEFIIADEFSAAFMLLSDGTVARLQRQDVQLESGDLVCLFKGAVQPSVVRPCGDDYTLLGQCYIRAGSFANENYNDDFWEGREMEEFRLV